MSKNYEAPKDKPSWDDGYRAGWDDGYRVGRRGTIEEAYYAILREVEENGKRDLRLALFILDQMVEKK